ncbi:MAG: Ig-like domain-containing protein, partial [bacterium]|nr:Ig-like domain-containing protein [bacterium]
MYQSILVRSGRSAVAFFSAIVAVALVGSLFVVPSVVFADVAPVTVGVSPALVKGGAVNTAYTFTVTKNSGDNITYVQIETSVLSINTDLSTVVCPTGLGTWTKSAEATKVICSKAQLGGNPITTNATISFQATAPSSDIAAAWTVTTLDTASAQVVNSPVTTVDATAPTISSITTKDTDSDGKVDTATIVFTEAVKDSTFAPNDFSIGGSAGTSFSGAADDNTLDVVVVSGVTGTEAKDVTYTKSAGAGADMVGNLLADVNTAAFNEIDGAAPVFMSARTQSPTTIHLTFSEDLLGTTITNTDFSVTGFTLTTPDATDTDTPGIVRLTVSTPFGSGDTPHVSYTGSVKDSPNLNTAPNRSDVTPTDGIAPTFTATRTAINTIVLTFSENVTSSGVDTDSFTVVGASAVSAGAVVGNTSITLTTTGLTTTDGTPAVNYVAANGDVVDTATNEVADGGAVVAADQVAPTIAITSSASPGPTNGPSIPMTVTFSETVTGFDIDDITVGNGTKAGFVAVSGTVYTFNITSPGQGTVTVDVAGSEAQDATLNNNTAATQFSITYDSIAPDITSIVLSDSALKVGETSLVTITFTEPVTGFTNADITTVDNGTLTDVASGDNITWTATFTPTTNFTGATNVLTITKTGIADLAGNAGVGTTNSGNYAIDTVLPTVGVTMGAATFKVGETTAVTFTFSEAPADFTTDDVTVGSGTIGAINTANPLIQTAIYTPTNDVEVGTNIITVGTAWTDAAGNTPLAGDDSPNYTIDTKKPSVALASVTANTTNGLIAVTAQFSESVTGFDATDVTVGNGAVGDFVAVDGDSYTFNVNPTDGGSVAVTIEVLADKAVDAAGNSNTASNQLTRTSDTIAPNAPTVTLLDPINNANKASATLRIVGESGTTYNYSIDDAGNAGTTAVVGSGTLTGGDQTVTGISVSDLDDGTLTASVTLTDTATNTGNAGTDTATKDVGVPSAPSTPDLAAASDSNIDTDNITNVTTPIFTGTAESGSTVTAYDTNGTTVIGTGIATGGNYSMVVSTLSSGVHSITVKTTDAAGNTSSASSALSVTIDTVLPNAVFSAATDDATPVTGALTSGQTTNDTALVLSGTNEAGSTVQVFNGTSSLAPAVVSGTTWSYTATVANGTTYQ